MFANDKMTRREAVIAAAMTLGATGLFGCGPVAATGKVVVRVAWPHVSRVISAILRHDGKIIITAIVAFAEHALNVTLTPQQSSELQRGGQLLLRTEDGVEHVVPFSLEP